ncbi:hypothetical protein DEO72_LG8g2370 [Vigna unguiculata]|nr:hypothetical protein DEO72_LG8g2370 [Vigna unguiculata]
MEGLRRCVGAPNEGYEVDNEGLTGFRMIVESGEGVKLVTRDDDVKDSEVEEFVGPFGDSGGRLAG